MKNRFNLNMHDYIHQAEGKLFFNREMFGTIAPRYDFITRALSFGQDMSWKNRLVNDLPDNKNAHCLDIACGTGDITFRLAAKYPAGHIVGLDVTKPMIDYARERNTFSNITFTLQDMCRTNFADESFDIVTGGYALRNAPNLEGALIEIRRVMKPGASAAFLDFSKPPNQFLQKTKGMLLKFWGGFWGILLLRNPQLYTYIAESLKQYPDRNALKQFLLKLGFTNIRSRKHFLGFAETITFQKP
ncbi:MAG: ubiquinone/menaquinone biosynthesis methyltransferase [Sedimentisphaerales bacterium]|jgi:demethylmenaquinone methyltransferase/2-methoxy-6-polyprenyl-1,4-benzoquinol methylase